MLKDIEWAEDGTYRPGDKFSPERFFDDCLHNSLEFDLQLGYFNSAAISVLSEGFATFISKGGIMRLVINHIVSEEDKEAIKSGVKGNVLENIDLTNFAELRKTFDDYQQQFFDCLSYLIFHRRIDIRIIRPLNRFGIAHTKAGQFRDGESITSFTGSANFTISGLFNNLEEIKIDRSISTDPMIINRISSQREKFDQIMNKEMNNIEYLSPDNLISALTTNSSCKDIEELLDVERKLREIKEKKLKTITPINDDSEVVYDLIPKFPYPSGPRDYQKEAFENWKNNGQKGLFAMATGTGKTITSLNCLLEIYKRFGYYKALIFVPTITLVEQWAKECRKFNFNNIIKVYSKNNQWLEDVERLAFNEKYNIDVEKTSYIIISTYASYSRPSVFQRLNCFDKRKVLMIADECHNMGSESMIDRMKIIPYSRRIGLSATPERQFDERGNNKLLLFFGAKEKYTYEYSMEEAINNGVLCKYMYFPHLIELTDNEMAEYVALSEKISRYFNYNTQSFDNSDDYLKMLLLARKRIIHKAENKLNTFKQIIQQRFEDKGNLNYTLVYVPEGNKPDYIINEEEFYVNDYVSDDSETDHLIDVYTKVVLQINDRVTVRKFMSGQKDRDEILKDFATGCLQVLTSMKCLDEGIDVPRSELAIFCSSTGNPRQFIQRRGRVLRTHPDKNLAVLHDLVVIPKVNKNANYYKMEQSLLRGELHRVKNFAMLSENLSYTELELREVMDYYGLNLYNNLHTL